MGKSKKSAEGNATDPNVKKAKIEKIRVVLGITLILFSLFCAFACLSFLFTWKADQSMKFHNFWDAAVLVENWGGKMGAWLANVFMYNWFGVAGFGVSFMVFAVGLRLLNLRIKNFTFGKSLVYTSFAMILTSFVLGYLFGNTWGYLGSGLGGAHGFFVVKYLNAFLGKLGTGLLLLLSCMVFVFFVSKEAYDYFKILLSGVNNKISNKIQGEEPVQNDTELEKPENIEKVNEDITLQINDDNVELVFETPAKIIIDEDAMEIIAAKAPGEIEIAVEKKKEEETVAQLTPLDYMGPYDPKLSLSHYRFPTIDLLQEHKSGKQEVSNEELVANKNKIVETLGHYKIQIDQIKATIGPTVTLYEIVPAPGVRISKIKNLEDDIALNLAALGIRIIAPMPGKGTIGIEVPNRNPEIVSMRAIISSRKFQETTFELPIALGKTISNETFCIDLAKMPHLLVAGATGQGKSVGLNAIITSLLYKKHPSELKFVLIDPKKVELPLYSKIENHYLARIPDGDEAIITDTQKVIYTLNSLVKEMEDRYDLLKKAAVRNIKEYNSRFADRRLNPDNGHRFLPYIVIVIDEFADFIMTAGREVETPIARLAQLARAIGIHLIIATQRPTTNVITGIIKANFPARIAFRVTSMIDSRTILDCPGANQLIGRGDMLVSQGSDLVRVQCAFIDTPEVEAITEFIGEQQGFGTAYILPEVVLEGMENTNTDFDNGKRDDIFEEAARLIVANQQGSTSLIQRKFSIGYNRAGRIMDQLEAAGIVGKNEGAKARQVLFSDLVSLDQYLSSMHN